MTDRDFRWQATFQRSTEPLFLLNRQLYLLFANEALESLSGLDGESLKRLWCARPDVPSAIQPWPEILGHILTPPVEAQEGMPCRARRFVPARGGRPAAWWDIDFFPFADADGVRGILGKVTAGPEARAAVAAVVTESLLMLRQQARDDARHLELVARLPATRRVAEQARLARASDCPGVLVGAAGTGKRTLAKLIHLGGERRDEAFAALDCRRLPAFAVGALLWGERGSAARFGLGTIYLAEPAALPRDVQERLLQWLREAKDGRRPRLLAGSRLDPAENVRSGALIDELRHALETLRIDLPTLAERHDELPHLVDGLLRRMNALGSPAIHGLSPDAWEILLAHRWPGNLRELATVLSEARRHARDGVIDAKDLPATLRQVAAMEQSPGARAPAPLPHRTLMEQVERRLVELALKRTRGNKRQAAKLLDVNVPWLYKRLNELGLVEPRADDEGGKP